MDEKVACKSETKASIVASLWRERFEPNTGKGSHTSSSISLCSVTDFFDEQSTEGIFCIKKSLNTNIIQSLD